VSVQSTSWVIKKSGQKGSNLLVLLMIADHADTAGRNAYPSVSTLAAESRLSERGVRYILAKLERSSELVIERNAGPYGTHLYSLPGVMRDGFNVRGLPANFAGRKQEGKSSASENLPAKFAPGCGNLLAKSDNSTGKSFAPEPKRTETKDKNLRPLMRPSPPACGNLGTESVEKALTRKETAATPQQRRFAIVGRLANAAAEILQRKPNCSHGDLTEELKQWAANEDVPYFDAWPGAATPIEQAITIAIERRKTE
jgi:Helix-turn-helix domain